MLTKWLLKSQAPRSNVCTFKLPNRKAGEFFTWVVFRYCCEYPIGLTFAPALCVLCWSFAAERVFAKYGAGLQNANTEDTDPQ